MPILHPKLSKKAKAWLVGGGAAVVLGACVAFGAARANLSNRLDNNDQCHTIIDNQIKDLAAGRQENKTNICVINTKLDALQTSMSEVKNDVRQIRSILEDKITLDEAKKPAGWN